MPAVKALFTNDSHLEPTRSAAAVDYVWKEDTRVEGTQFELGVLGKQGKTKVNWEAICNKAVAGDLEGIRETEPGVYARNINSLLKIASMHAQPEDREGGFAKVFVGPTGTGKSHRAFKEIREQGGPFYIKSASNKWWCGYKGEENVLIDEMSCKTIGITHLLRWFDQYPYCVEIKGGSIPLRAKRFWITSNLWPHQWFEDVDIKQIKALERRLTIIEMNEAYVPPAQE